MRESSARSSSAPPEGDARNDGRSRGVEDKGRRAAKDNAEPSREAALEHAIATLTRRLSNVADEEIGELVSERRAMREELAALRTGAAGNVVDLSVRRRVVGA